MFEIKYILNSVSHNDASATLISSFIIITAWQGLQWPTRRGWELQFPATRRGWEQLHAASLQLQLGNAVKLNKPSLGLHAAFVDYTL